jgi:hypothetical protein
MTGAWWSIDDEKAPAEAAASDSRAPVRELVPEGEHDLQIKAVIDHGDRLEVRLAHDDKRLGWVFQRLPKGPGWSKVLTRELAEALAISAEEWEPAIKAGDLAGRRVIARIYHKVDAAGGKTWVNVGNFKRTEALAEAVAITTPEPAPKPAPARTATKKADAVGHDPDDIPF